MPEDPRYCQPMITAAKALAMLNLCMQAITDAVYRETNDQDAAREVIVRLRRVYHITDQ